MQQLPAAHAEFPPSPVPMTAAQNRLIAAAVFIVCSAVLALATFLSPNYGLSEMFGYPSCGFKTTTGLPCVTCGMTTSFTLAMDGDLLGAFRMQPAGTLLALFVMMLAIVAAVSVFTGMSLGPLAKAVFRPRYLIILGCVIALGWGYSIAQTLGALG